MALCSNDVKKGHNFEKYFFCRIIHDVQNEQHNIHESVTLCRVCKGWRTLCSHAL